MSTCPNPMCGAPDPIDSDFCKECGEYLRIDELTAERSVEHTAPAGPPDPLPAARDAEPAPAPATPSPAAAPVAVAAPAPEPAPQDEVALHLRLPGSEARPDSRPIVEVEPGGVALLEALVRNQGTRTASFEVRVEGIADDWWSVPHAPLYLNPMAARAEDADGRLEITFRPPRASAAEARAWDIEVVAQSSVDPEVCVRAPATLVIGPFADTAVVTQPAVRAGRLRARFDVAVENRGNAPVQLTLGAADPEDSCRVAVEPATVPLAPGARGSARLTVRPRRQRWFGRVVEHRLALDAKPAAAAPQLLPATVTFKQRAWLPWWVPPAVIFAIALALLLPKLLPQTVRVPEVRGAASTFEAQRLLTPSGLKVAAGPELRSDDRFEPGTVIDQTPAPGEKAERGSTVTLVIAAGSGKGTVPDLSGMTLQEADAALNDAELKLGRVTPDIDYEARIAEQIPAAGAERPTGASVDVTLEAEGGAGPGPGPTPGPDPSPDPSPTATPPPAPAGEPKAPLVFDDAENLMLLAPGETEAEPLTRDDASTQPSVSADGSAIAYRREVDGRGRIYLLHPDQDDAPGQPLTPARGDFSRPLLLPDGETVAFVRHPDYALCVQRLDERPGSEQCIADGRWAFNRPTVSPAGTSILAVGISKSDESRTGLVQFTRSASGTWAPARRGLVMEVADVKFVAWGPDGKVAVMAGDRSQAAQLMLVPAEGDALDPSAAERRPVFGCELAWRADGRLAVANHACHEEIANGPIVVVDVESGTGTEVGVQGGNPAWKPAQEDAT